MYIFVFIKKRKTGEKIYIGLELVGGGSVINRATLSSLFLSCFTKSIKLYSILHILF